MSCSYYVYLGPILEVPTKTIVKEVSYNMCLSGGCKLKGHKTEHAYCPQCGGQVLKGTIEEKDELTAADVFDDDELDGYGLHTIYDDETRFIWSSNDENTLQQSVEDCEHDYELPDPIKSIEEFKLEFAGELEALRKAGLEYTIRFGLASWVSC